MDRILNLLLKPKTEFIICGDININYMEMSNNRKSLDNLLAIQGVPGGMCQTSGGCSLC